MKGTHGDSELWCNGLSAELMAWVMCHQGSVLLAHSCADHHLHPRPGKSQSSWPCPGRALYRPQPDGLLLTPLPTSLRADFLLAPPIPPALPNSPNHRELVYNLECFGLQVTECMTQTT